MGIKGLTAWIKACARLEEDLTKKTCHLDFAAMFFALLNAHAFYATVESEGKHTRNRFSTETTVSAHQSGVERKRPSASIDASGSELENRLAKSARLTSVVPQVHQGSSTIEPDLADGGGTSSLGGGRADWMVADSTGSGTSGQDDIDTASPGSFSPSFIGMIQELLQEQPTQIFLDSNGALTTTHAQSKGRLSKESTTIHADGPQPVEKERAHQKRDSALEKQSEKLGKDYADGKIKGTKNLYRRIKFVYRAPPEALRHVLDVLMEEG
ncbi:hypothetical protein BGZ58_006835 [Dissophora ornata]|nr:hypothetical protein BGZ58_006835 [Dissophora ornata]